jgi:DNA-directed RNA polymerase specialized sigma24 family protein
MGKTQSNQELADETLEGLRRGEPDAGINQRLVSAQNFVITQRRGYQNSLENRAQVIHLAHAAGWSKYRIAQRLGVTRRAVDEALERAVPRTPEQFLDLEVKRNGGLENPDVRRIRELLAPRAGS